MTRSDIASAKATAHIFKKFKKYAHVEIHSNGTHVSVSIWNSENMCVCEGSIDDLARRGSSQIRQINKWLNKNFADMNTAFNPANDSPSLDALTDLELAAVKAQLEQTEADLAEANATIDSLKEAAPEQTRASSDVPEDPELDYSVIFSMTDEEPDVISVDDILDGLFEEDEEPEEKPAPESDFNFDEWKKRRTERPLKWKQRHKLEAENCDYIAKRLIDHIGGIDVIPHWKIERFAVRTGYVWDNGTAAGEMFDNLDEWKDALIELFQEDIDGVCTPVKPLQIEVEPPEPDAQEEPQAHQEQPSVNPVYPIILHPTAAYPAHQSAPKAAKESNEQYSYQSLKESDYHCPEYQYDELEVFFSEELYDIETRVGTESSYGQFIESIMNPVTEPEKNLVFSLKEWHTMSHEEAKTLVLQHAPESWEHIYEPVHKLAPMLYMLSLPKEMYEDALEHIHNNLSEYIKPIGYIYNIKSFRDYKGFKEMKKINLESNSLSNFIVEYLMNHDETLNEMITNKEHLKTCVERVTLMCSTRHLDNRYKNRYKNQKDKWNYISDQIEALSERMWKEVGLADFEIFNDSDVEYSAITGDESKVDIGYFSLGRLENTWDYFTGTPLSKKEQCLLMPAEEWIKLSEKEAMSLVVAHTSKNRWTTKYFDIWITAQAYIDYTRPLSDFEAMLDRVNDSIDELNYERFVVKYDDGLDEVCTKSFETSINCLVKECTDQAGLPDPWTTWTDRSRVGKKYNHLKKKLDYCKMQAFEYQGHCSERYLSIRVCLTDTISDEEMTAVYKKLRSKHHPDKGGDAVMFRMVKPIYDYWINNISDEKTKCREDAIRKRKMGF